MVHYAAVRGIDVIPEVDMPGHMLAAVSNYAGVSCFRETGWGSMFSSPVCPGKESALEFCKNVYAEIFPLFPYKYVHLGADEVEKTNWKKCPDCQKRMKDNGLKTEEELQSWFVHQMEDYFNANGKELIGWDEIIEGGLSETATVMWWRNWNPEAVPTATAQGNPVICCPNAYFYLDYRPSGHWYWACKGIRGASGFLPANGCNIWSFPGRWPLRSWDGATRLNVIGTTSNGA